MCNRVTSSPTSSFLKARDISLAGLLGALGLVLPMLFHLVGLGRVFLPMFIPILMAGLLISPWMAALVGIVVPLLSALLTGMPPLVPPTAILMAIELPVMAMVAHLLYRRWRLHIVIAVTAALVAGKLMTGIEIVTIAPLFGLQRAVIPYLVVTTVASLPGIILNIVVVPLAVKAIERVTLVPPGGPSGPPTPLSSLPSNQENATP